MKNAPAIVSRSRPGLAELLAGAGQGRLDALVARSDLLRSRLSQVAPASEVIAAVDSLRPRDHA